MIESTPIQARFNLDGSPFNQFLTEKSQSIVEQSLQDFNSPILTRSQAEQMNIDGVTNLFKNSLDLAKKLLSGDVAGAAVDVVENWISPMIKLAEEQKAQKEATAGPVLADSGFSPSF